MNLVLSGLPRCGKTTIGKMVAEQLGCPFIDTDRLIEAVYAMQTGKRSSCRQIFLQEGEAAFRALEKDQIVSLSETKNSVIAIGGGSLTDKESMKILQSVGHIIYLKASVKILFERMLLSGLPAYLNAHDPENDFYALATVRMPLYEKAAHEVVDTSDVSVEEIVFEVLKNERKIKDGE